jgi:hypothetical protein
MGKVEGDKTYAQATFDLKFGKSKNKQVARSIHKKAEKKC